MNNTGKKWMNDCKDKIWDKPINKIKLAGTHSSATNRIDWSVKPQVNATFTRLYNMRNCCFVKSMLKDWTLTQYYSVSTQLEKGIRYFDFKVALINGKFYVAHTYIGVPVENVLKELKEFLDNNPTEFIILDFKNDWENRKTMTARDNLVFLNFVYSSIPNEYFITHGTDEQYPTYGEIMKNGQRVLLFYKNVSISLKYLWTRYHSGWTTTLNPEIKYLFLHNLLQTMQESNINVLEFTLTAGEQDIIKDILHRIFLPFLKPNSIQNDAPKIQKLLVKFVDENKRKTLEQVSIFLADYPSDDFINFVINLNK